MEHKPNNANAIEKFSALLLCVLVPYFYFYHFVIHSLNLTVFVIVLVFSILINLGVYRHSRNQLVAGRVIMVIGWVSIIYTAIFTGNIYSPVFPWALSAPLVGAYLEGKKGLNIWSFMLVVVTSMMIIYHFNFIPPKSVLTPWQSKTLFLITLVSMIVLMITISYLFQKNINNALKKAELKTVQLNQLLRLIGHDISTPISLIKGIVDIAIRDSKSLELEKLKKVSTAANTIHQILKQSREFQTVSARKTHYDLKKIAVDDLLHKTQEHFISRAHKKLLDLSIQPSPNQPILILSNEDILLTKVLYNLVDNAIKFSLPNTQISLEVSKAENKFCKIIVKDQGIGIPPDLLKEVLTPHNRTNRLGTEGESGSGFGLPLVEKYTQHLGGKLTITSQSIEDHPDNHGSTVTLFIPLAG